MIANFSPGSSHCEHTLNTLRYADRVKEFKKSPKEKNGDDYQTPTPSFDDYNKNDANGAMEAFEEDDLDNDSQDLEIEQVDEMENEYGNVPKSISEMNDEEKKSVMKKVVDEEVLASHRQHIEEVMKLMKQEMKLLHMIEQPGSAIDEYVTNLDCILVRKMQAINTLREKYLL